MGAHVYQYPVTRRMWWGRRGGVVVKVLLLLALVALVYFGLMLVPPYIENFKFDSALEAAARHATVEKNDLVLLSMIQKEAETLGIRVLGEDISIQRDPDNSSISIRTRYRREVVLKPSSATITLEFSNDAQNRL